MIYFPYAGIIKAAGKSQNDLREDLRKNYQNILLIHNWIFQLLDLTQKVYLLGEVTRPEKINITDILYL